MPVKTFIKSNSFIGLLLILVGFLSACVEDDTCGENTISGVMVAIANSGSDSSTDTDTLNEKSVTNWKICPINDTISFTSMDTSYTSGIPLNINDTSVAVVFMIRDNEDEDYINDTLHLFYHQKELKLISMQCGFAPLYELSGLDHTLHVLDSVVLNEIEVSTDLMIDNVTLYY